MTSENPFHGGSQHLSSASENTEPSRPKRRGARPTPLPAEYEEILAGYATALDGVPLSADTRRTYLSRIRMYLAWLTLGDGRRRFRGDPLTNPTSRDWAVRDYRLYLLREADPKRSVRYVNNALAALDDFCVRLGMGKANIAREDIPKTAPRAMDTNAQIRWLRAIEDWPHARDRVLALLPFYAGLRIGDAVALDVPDVRISARKRVLVVYGKIREVPIHAQLRGPLTGWLGERPAWPGVNTSKALFLNRRGGRLTTRGASGIFTAIGQAAGLDEATTAHIGRHTFVTQLIRGGEDLVTVAEIAGHARLETLRSYSQPSDDDKLNALRHLTVDR